MSKEAHKLTTLEYSINNGTSWTAFGNITNTGVLQTLAQRYQIKARQKDRAGNVSDESNVVDFTWDRGTLISRISSTSANGTYTNNVNKKDTINITVYFRKSVRFTNATGTTINLSNITNAGGTITLDNYAASPVTELSFTYTVGANANTTAGQRLNASFSVSADAQDENGVRVNNFFGTPPSGSTLSDLNDITVSTAALSVTTPAAFNNSLVTTTGGVTSGLQADGSYNSALAITFNQDIIKGSGQITIIQQTTNYRLPAVLTESQFSKYSSIANVNTYYTRGTNGYIAGSGADTSIKYILRYDVDTAAAANAPGAGAGVPTLAEAFRQAEKVVLDVNAQAVRINGSQLIVELTGSYALQVPGATYQVTYPDGLVLNKLENPCTAVNNQNAPLPTGAGSVAKPFIRINKQQETITVNNNPSVTVPLLAATQPFQAGVRMDCRTPGSAIYYLANEATTNVTAQNWNTSGANVGPGDLTTPAAPNRPNQPTNGSTAYNNAFNIGSADTYQGLQWYCRARSYVNPNYSEDSDEMAFRTVVTYQITNMSDTQGYRPGSASAGGGGEQIWIRGGDDISTSSVPGFPLTWADDWDALKRDGKRAGIRLFTLETVTTNFYTASTWRWVTWEINVDTYFDIICGRNTTMTAAEAMQYGPKNYAYQRAGWTAYKTESRILPGKHRYLAVTNASIEGKGAVNFSNTWSARPFANADVTP
jgi:hypothetical protein